MMRWAVAAAVYGLVVVAVWGVPRVAFWFIVGACSVLDSDGPD